MYIDVIDEINYKGSTFPIVDGKYAIWQTVLVDLLGNAVSVYAEGKLVVRLLLSSKSQGYLENVRGLPDVARVRAVSLVLNQGHEWKAVQLYDVINKDGREWSFSNIRDSSSPLHVVGDFYSEDEAIKTAREVTCRLDPIANKPRANITFNTTIGDPPSLSMSPFYSDLLKEELIVSEDVSIYCGPGPSVDPFIFTAMASMTPRVVGILTSRVTDTI